MQQAGGGQHFQATVVTIGSMDLAALIARYGLAAVFAGSMLEGETVLLLAGYAAHRGFLDWGWVVAVAVCGAVLGDQFWFTLGRRHGARVVSRRPWLGDAVRRALDLIERRPVGMVLAMRFAWGLRTALPIAAGMSRVRWQTFVLLNILSAVLWAPLVAGTGYLFGTLLTQHLKDLHRIEHWLMLGVVLIALALHLLNRCRKTTRPARHRAGTHD